MQSNETRLTDLPDEHGHFGPYGGIFVAGSLAWGIVVDRFRPDVWDWTGATLCLVGAGIIMLAPR